MVKSCSVRNNHCLVVRWRPLVLCVHEVYSAMLDLTLGASDLALHVVDGCLQSVDTVASLVHQLFEPFCIHQFALNMKFGFRFQDI